MSDLPAPPDEFMAALDLLVDEVNKMEIDVEDWLQQRRSSEAAWLYFCLLAENDSGRLLRENLEVRNQLIRDIQSENRQLVGHAGVVLSEVRMMEHVDTIVEAFRASKSQSTMAGLSLALANHPCDLVRVALLEKINDDSTSRELRGFLSLALESMPEQHN